MSAFELSRFRHPRPALFSVALALALTSCALLETEPKVPKVRSAQTDAREAQRATVKRLVERLAVRARERREGRLDILLLSAGGQYGAYAAGFLRGWESRSAPAMPHFDLVTAVDSTALLAPFALLGTAEALAEGAKLFREAPLELAPSAEFWPELQSDKPSSFGRYRDTVENLFDDDFQSELHHEFLANREIVLATTDFDLGAPRFWELGYELGEDERGLHRARALMVASAAAPGVFTPTLIDRHVHGAGDVFGNLVVPFNFENFRRLAARLRAHEVSETVEVRFWVIMNGFASAGEADVDPESRSDMIGRSLSLAFRAAQTDALDRLEDLARAVNGSLRGVRVQVQVTMIPESLAYQPGANERYSAAYMLSLEQEGYERARGDSAWDRSVVYRDRYDDDRNYD